MATNASQEMDRQMDDVLAGIKKGKAKPRKELLEKLAELEHEQWSTWVSQVIATEDNLNPVRLERWERLSRKEYSELTEKEKDADRHWAERVLDILEADRDG